MRCIHASGRSLMNDDGSGGRRRFSTPWAHVWVVLCVLPLREIAGQDSQHVGWLGRGGTAVRQHPRHISSVLQQPRGRYARTRGAVGCEACSSHGRPTRSCLAPMRALGPSRPKRGAERGAFVHQTAVPPSCHSRRHWWQGEGAASKQHAAGLRPPPPRPPDR